MLIHLGTGKQVNKAGAEGWKLHLPVVCNNLPPRNLFSAVFASNFDKDGETQLQSPEDIC